MKRLLIMVLLFATQAGAQIVLNAGSSTLLGGSGAEAAYYTADNNVMYGGLGFGAGQFRASLGDQFKWRQNDVITVGESNFGMGFSSAVGVQLLGVSMEHKTTDSSSTIFLGMTGSGYSSPFLTASSPQHLSIGALFIRRLSHDIRLYSLNVINGGTKTFSEGLSYQYRRTLLVSGSGGIQNSSKFMVGQMVYTPHDGVNFYASHSDNFEPYHATGNSLGASVTAGSVSLSSSFNESLSKNRMVTGESLSLSTRVKMVQVQAGWYDSAGKSFLNGNFTETVHHLMANETVTHSSGQNSYAFGGGYTSNRFSASVNHSIVFLLNGEGFTQVTGISLSARIPKTDASVNFTSIKSSFDQNLYSISGTDYIQAGDIIPGHVTHSRAVGYRYIISGVVRDQKGQPVYGAAIEVGNVIAFSNTQGQWCVRVKKQKEQSILVLPAIFMSPGTYIASSSNPASARPGELVQIEVERR
jgi:hypothetical protein